MGNQNKLSSGIKILNCEGKDIIKGYSRFNSKGEINIKKYKGDFDYSLALIKLEEILEQYNSENENKIELYNEMNGRLYSDVLICLNFNYNLKDDLDNKNVAKLVIGIEECKKEIAKIREENQECNKSINKILYGYKKDTLKEKEEVKNNENLDKLEKKNKIKILSEKLSKEYIINNKVTPDDKIKIKYIENAKEENKKLIKDKKEEIKYIKAALTTEGIREKLYCDGFELRTTGEYDELYWSIVKKKQDIEKAISKGVAEDTIRKYNKQLSNMEKELENMNPTTNKFVRFVRSSGSSRVGKCLFIREELYRPMMEWLKMGLDIPEDEIKECDLASIEAYLSLTTSSIIDTFKLEPKNILLVEDVKSKFPSTAMVTKLDDMGMLITKEEELEMENSLFDGASLIDFSVFDNKEQEEYIKNGGVQIRNGWFKGFAFTCGIQRFFKDNNITEISQLNGKTIATDVKDIKLIATPSSLKYLKGTIGGNFKSWLNELDNLWIKEENKNTWGICSTPHSPKFINGTHVQSHYQLLNNLQLNECEVKELLKPTLEYIDLLKNDLDVFKYHIRAKLGKLDEELKVEGYEENDNTNKIGTSTNDFMINMVTLNDDFAKTELFKKYRKDSIDNYIENIKNGHVLIPGTYAVVIANSIDYLYHAIGKLKKDDNGTVISKMKSGSEECEVIMCNRFKYNQKLLLSRSPMPVQGNIVLAENVYNKEIAKYFGVKEVSENGKIKYKLPKNIMHINVVNTNVMERGSSFDMDGDKFLITNCETLINAAIQNYNKFKVPVNMVKSKKTKRYTFSSKSKCELDIATSKNNIGRIINASMILVSEFWDRVNNMKGIDGELYSICAELSIMSCICIDAAKKVMPYDEEKILSKIESCEYYKRGKYYLKVKEGKKTKIKLNEDGEPIIKDGKIRPLFFSIVGEGKNYRFEEFKCTMDILNKLLGTNAPDQPEYKKDKKNKSIVKQAKRNETIDLIDLFSSIAKKAKTGDANLNLVGRFVREVEEYTKTVKGIRISDKDSKTRYKEACEAEKDFKEAIKKDLKKIGRDEMVTILKRLNKDGFVTVKKNKEGKEHTVKLSSIERDLVHMLYEINPIMFLQLFKETKTIDSNKENESKESIDNEIEIYGMIFNKAEYSLSFLKNESA